MRWTRTLAVVLIAAALTGCAATQPKTALREGARMVDLYRGTVAPEQRQAAADEPGTASADVKRCGWWLLTWRCQMQEAAALETAPEEPSYARTAANELELLFPRLPNPDVYIYVLPHLATDARVPVPGYTTAVPLYERVEYALPGELSGGGSGDLDPRDGTRTEESGEVELEVDAEGGSAYPERQDIGDVP